MENLKVIHKRGSWTLGAQWCLLAVGIYCPIYKHHPGAFGNGTAAGLLIFPIWGNFLTGKKESLLQFLEKAYLNQVEPMHDFQVQYNAVLNENGGLVDDITIYKFNDENI